MLYRITKHWPSTCHNMNIFIFPGCTNFAANHTPKSYLIFHHRLARDIWLEQASKKVYFANASDAIIICSMKCFMKHPTCVTLYTQANFMLVNGRALFRYYRARLFSWYKYKHLIVYSLLYCVHFLVSAWTYNHNVLVTSAAIWVARPQTWCVTATLDGQEGMSDMYEWSIH